MRFGNAKSKTPFFCLPLLSPFYIFAYITNKDTDIMKLLLPSLRHCTSAHANKTTYGLSS